MNGPEFWMVRVEEPLSDVTGSTPTNYTSNISKKRSLDGMDRLVHGIYGLQIPWMGEVQMGLRVLERVANNEGMLVLLESTSSGPWKSSFPENSIMSPEKALSYLNRYEAAFSESK
ncbi:hypothetical protein AMTR_s00072p00151120 [Amborella trichopoda]|uniref:Uncharacterized protein n=1 Tax=Amborella trichopoda TaxID=13333 RepID=W1NUW5_AMBTC|nr:hypothetical protein AMTR_s00072p00151120 [Amborella trichopoda]